MARVGAILTALWTALRRDRKTLGSFTGNNLFLLSLVFLFMSDRGAFLSLNVFIGLALFLPLSADPLRKIPAVRMALWPMSRRERLVIRGSSPFFNPVMWLLVALAAWRRVTIGLWGATAGAFAMGFVLPSAHSTRLAWSFLPAFPGRLGQLARKNLRELMVTLDFYCALVPAFGALCFRAAGELPREALLPLTMLVEIALSTPALNLFGLESPGGLTRYRLLPLRGWQILVAKDGAFLIVSTILTLPLAPLAGLSAALSALAVGHFTSIMLRRDETRWRFSTAPTFAYAMAEIVSMILAGCGTALYSPLVLLGPLAAFALSARKAGRLLEQ